MPSSSCVGLRTNYTSAVVQVQVADPNLGPALEAIMGCPCTGLTPESCCSLAVAPPGNFTILDVTWELDSDEEAAGPGALLIRCHMGLV